MCDFFAADRLVTAAARAILCAVLAAVALGIVLVSTRPAAAEAEGSELVLRPGAVSEFEQGVEGRSPEAFVPTLGNLEELQPATPVVGDINVNHSGQTGLREINFQSQPAAAPQRQSLQLDLAQDPCAAMDEKPLATLGIGIALPAGKLPDDPATACWSQLNESTGPAAALRCWPTQVCNWNAACTCHRPLYFEQINLERHGYGCCQPLQPLASAAHFFATVPALPYCMAVECPCKCVYTLGHYRPGSCPPWRHHWPPCSPLAAAAEGGVWTGMVFLIP